MASSRGGSANDPPASTASTGCHPEASRSSTTRPAGPGRRPASRRTSSSRSTRWPAATRSVSADPSGSRSISPRPPRARARPARTSSSTPPAPRSSSAPPACAPATSPPRLRTGTVAGATTRRCARVGGVRRERRWEGVLASPHYGSFSGGHARWPDHHYLNSATKGQWSEWDQAGSASPFMTTSFCSLAASSGVANR